MGTHNTVNKVFHLVAFECMFTHRSFTLENGLVGKDPSSRDTGPEPVVVSWIM